MNFFRRVCMFASALHSHRNPFQRFSHSSKLLLSCYLPSVSISSHQFTHRALTYILLVVRADAIMTVLAVMVTVGLMTVLWPPSTANVKVNFYVSKRFNAIHFDGSMLFSFSFPLPRCRLVSNMWTLLSAYHITQQYCTSSAFWPIHLHAFANEIQPLTDSIRVWFHEI